MTDVTTEYDQNMPRLSAADEQTLRELTERARAGGLKLTDEGRLLGQLTRIAVESALEGELSVSTVLARWPLRELPPVRPTGSFLP